MDFAEALRAYRSFDPSGWVGVYRLAPVGAGVLLVLMGGALMLHGSGRFFRMAAGPMGMWLGTLWGGIIVTRLGLPWPEAETAPLCGAALCVLGLVYPQSVVLLAAGMPAGIVAGELAGDADWALGFIPAFLVCGALALFAQRPVTAVVTSVLGAWLSVLGLLAALHPVGTISATVASQPSAALLAAGLFAAAGASYQLAVRLTPEEAERKAFEEAQARKQEREKQALEKRWKGYSDSGEKPEP